jgi:hypothetical protein
MTNLTQPQFIGLEQPIRKNSASENLQKRHIALSHGIFAHGHANAGSNPAENRRSKATGVRLAHQKRPRQSATKAIKGKRKYSKIDEADRFSAAHHGPIAGSIQLDEPSPDGASSPLT